MNVVSKLNAELVKLNVNGWLKTNKLSSSVHICKYMIFHTTKKKVNALHLMIDDIILERVHDFNCLELTLNEHLNCN